MNFLLYFLIFLKFVPILGQQVIYFNSLTGAATPFGSQNQKLSIFASAQVDNDELLSKIIVQDSRGALKTAADLKNMPNPADMKLEWSAVGPISISTSLTSDQISSLTGLFYLLPMDAPTQPDVYDLTEAQLVNQIVGGGTMVIMNTNRGMNTKFSQWYQNSDATVTIYSGIPDVSNSTDDIYFSNPLKLILNDPNIPNPLSFENVEPFVLSLPIFYIKIFGRAQLSVEPGSLDQRLIQTTKPSTTGILTKGHDEMEETQVVQFTGSKLADGGSGFTAVTGFKKMGFVLANITLGSGEQIPIYLDHTTSSGLNKMFDTLTIEPKNVDYYHIQYYRYEIPGTAPETSTSKNVGTTKTTAKIIETTTTTSTGFSIFRLSVILFSLITYFL